MNLVEENLEDDHSHEADHQCYFVKHLFICIPQLL